MNRAQRGQPSGSLRSRLGARLGGESQSLPREVYVLGLIAFCVAVGFGVLVPVLPVFARSFGVSNFKVGAVISAFALMRLVASPFCGRLITVFGERLVMAVGIYIVAISSGLAGIAHSYEQLLLLRGVGGIGSAMFTVSAFTLLLTSVDAGAARPGRRLLPGRLPDRRDGRPGGRRASCSTISLTAPFFFYAGHPGGRPAPSAGCCCTRSEQAETAQRCPEVGPFRHGAPRRPLSGRLLHQPRPGLDLVRRPVLAGPGPGRRVAAPASRPGPGSASPSPRSSQTIAVGPAGKFVDTVGRRPAMIAGDAVAGVVDRWPSRSRRTSGWLIVALAVYGVASAFLGTAPAAAVGDAGGGRRGTAGGGVLDVLRRRRDHRPAGGRPAGRRLVLPRGVRASARR